jgi:hypothetical protein
VGFCCLFATLFANLAFSTTQCEASPETTCSDQAYFGKIPLAPHSVEFYSNGSVKSGRLGQDAQVGDYLLSRWTLLHFHEDGLLARAHSPVQQQSGDVSVPQGARMEFYRSGRLKQLSIERIGGWYRDRYYPGGTVLSFSADGTVVSDTFYPNAKRIQDPLNHSRGMVVLARDWSTPHVSLPAGTLVVSSSARKLLQVIMPSNWHWGGFEFARGEAWLRRDGRVQRATLAREQTINGIVWRANDAPLEFHDNDQLASGSLAFDQQINGAVFRAPRDGYTLDSTRVHFLKDGTLVKGTVSGDIDQTIQGYPVLRYSEVHFHRNGSIAQFRLAADTALGSWSMKAGTLLELDAKGRPVSGVVAAISQPDGLSLPDGARLKWYPNGGIHTIDAPIDMVVDRILLARYRSEEDTIALYKNGRLRTGRVAEDMVLEGVSLERGSIVFMKEDGRLDRFTPPDQLWIDWSTPPVVLSGPKPIAPVQGWPNNICEQYEKNGGKPLIGFSMGSGVPDCASPD